MNYLLAAYGIAIAMIGGYVYYLVRQVRETTARLRGPDDDPR